MLKADQAIEKLNNERKALPVLKPNEIAEKLRKDPPGAKACIVADAVLEVMEGFCRQSETFADAVLVGKPFDDCLKEVTKGLGHYADSKMYEQCVKQYIPGAKIRVQWKVILPEENGKADSEPGSFMLDLADLLN